MKREDIINKLYKKYPISDIIKFSENDIQDKLKDNVFNIVKYTELYQKELDIYNKINTLLDKVCGEKYDYYRFNFEKELKQSEIEKYYLPKDKKICKINTFLRRQKWRVDFFHMCMKAFEKQSWNMKTFWDSIKGGL